MGVAARVAALVLVVCAQARAVEPWEKAILDGDPRLVLRAAGAPPAGAEAELLLDDARYTFSADGRAVYRWRAAYKVATEQAARRWATVEAAWSPWSQERPQIRARVITPDGAVHPLDPATLAEAPLGSSQPDVHDDRRVLSAPLPAVGAGAIVEEEIVLADRVPPLAGGETRRIVFGSELPVRRARLTLEAPPSLPLRWEAHGTTLAPRREGAALVFEAGPLPPLAAPESALPPEIPRVAYVGFSTGKSWADVAARYAAVLDQQLARADVTALARDAAAGARDRDEVAARIVARVRKEIRYTGVELGDAGQVPRPPTETLARRYGDCKDQALLTVAMLRAVGVPSEVVLLDAGPGADMDEGLPGLGSFDHAVVLVTGEKPLWIDPTDPYARVGELPAGDQGRLVLVASRATRGLTRAPVAPPTANQVVERREVFLAELGAGKVVETTEPRGASERTYRGEFARAEEKAIRDQLGRYAEREYGARQPKSSWSAPGDLAAPFRLRIEAPEADHVYTDEQGASVALYPSSLVRDLPQELTQAPGKDDKPRAHDYQLAEALAIKRIYRIVAAPEFAPRRLPEPRTIAIGPWRATVQVSAERDGAVRAELAFVTDRLRLTPAEVAKVRADVARLSGEEPMVLGFDLAPARAIADGKVRAGLDGYRRLIALHPAEALHHTQLAMALVRAGLGDAARPEAERAVALEPSSAVAHRRRGFVLGFDLYGRRFHRGCDRAGAEAEYRKAIALDPRDAAARADLALPLEHDADGVRWGAGARLDDAVALYRGLRKDLDDHRFDEQLLTDLVYLGRFGEARDEARALAPSPWRNALGLAATAGVDGKDAAIAWAESGMPDREARRSALGAAGGYLMRLRRYPEAAALMAAAGDGSADLRAVIEPLSRARRWEELKFPANDPTSVVRKLYVALIAGRDDLAALRGLLARDLFSSDAELKDVWSGARRGRRQAQANGLPLAVSLDVALAVVDMATDGDDRGGWRIRVRTPANDQNPFSEVFVVREAGGYRLRGFSAAPWALGDEALTRVEAGDLEGARRWLRWAGAEAPPERDALRTNAALLAAQGPHWARALPILERCGEARCEQRRASVLRGQERWADLLALADKMAARPDARPPTDLRAAALFGLRRFDEVERLTAERMAVAPGDRAAVHFRVKAAEWRGDLAAADALLTADAAAGGDAWSLNEAAWMALVRGHVDDAAIALARRSVAQNADAPALHTLASLYAAHGQPIEALDSLHKSLAAAGRDDPEGADFYVIGLVADDYGVPEVARAAYQRVPRPREVHPVDTWLLAQKRLAGK